MSKILVYIFIGFVVLALGGAGVLIFIGQSSGSPSSNKRTSGVSALGEGGLDAGFSLLSDSEAVAGYQKHTDDKIRGMRDEIGTMNRDNSMRNDQLLRKLDEMSKTISVSSESLEKRITELEKKQSSMDTNVARVLQGQEGRLVVAEEKITKAVEGINNFINDPRLMSRMQEKSSSKSKDSSDNDEKAKAPRAESPVLQKIMTNQISRQEELKEKSEYKPMPELKLDLGDTSSAGNNQGSVGSSFLPSYEGIGKGKPAFGMDDPSLIAGLKYSATMTTLGSVDIGKDGPGGPKLVIPALSRVKASIIHGAMAPVTGKPAPLLFYVGTAWVGPNHSRVPLQGIMIVGMATGQTNGSRAIVEPVLISGVTPNGEAFSLPCNGYVIGKDAMEGIKGILRDVPPGYWMKVTPLNFLSAGAAAMADSTKQTTSTYGGQQFTNTTPGKELAGAGYSALSKSLTEAADVFNRRLRDWQICVEVEPKQDVVIVLLQEVIVNAMTQSLVDGATVGKAKSVIR